MRHKFIYAIKHPAGVYIGCSVDPRHRFVEHMSLLRRGKHSNHGLRSAFKENPDAFCVEILEAGIEENDPLSREEFWMCAAASIGNVLNILPGPNALRKRTVSEETKEKTRASLIGRNTRSAEAIAASREKLKGRKKPAHVIAAAVAGSKKAWIERGHEMRRKCRKLSDEQIAEVRQAIENGEKYSSIGGRFGISAATVCLIHKGRRYADVPILSRP